MRKSGKSSRRGASSGEINDDGVIPLINIVFLLLVFFLLAGHIAPPEPADITPPTSSSIADDPAKPAVLHITADGTIQHNGAVIADLMATTTLIANTAKDSPVIIRADQGAPAARVLAAAHALKMARVSESRLVVILGR